MLLNGHEWSWMVLDGIEWYWMVLNGIEWYWMVLNGIEWLIRKVWSQSESVTDMARPREACASKNCWNDLIYVNHIVP